MIEKLEYYARLTDNKLRLYLDGKDGENQISKAMSYSLFAGGKRLRAAILLGFCEAYGGDAEKAASVAAALECIHTFSLIHDDLPCMDDDDMRRGKPSCHKAFNEAIAVLAGDALSISAFELVAGSDIPPQTAIRIIADLSKLSGKDGMLLGQDRDIAYETLLPDKDELLSMYKLKTCNLFVAAAKCGALLANADERQLQNAQSYAESLGLAFQIIDDILDVTSDNETLGKPIGSDNLSGKTTAVTLFTLDGARKMARGYTDKALECAQKLPYSDFIIQLTEKLLERKK